MVIEDPMPVLLGAGSTGTPTEEDDPVGAVLDILVAGQEGGYDVPVLQGVRDLYALVVERDAGAGSVGIWLEGGEEYEVSVQLGA